MNARGLDSLRQRLVSVIKEVEGEVGVAVMTDQGDTLRVHNEGEYPMMSVFKFHQALAVADWMRRYRVSPDSLITIRQEELRKDTYSPLRDEHTEEQFQLSLKDLLAYTLQRSDNNACDLLFRRFVSVTQTDAYIRSLGISGFTITENEEAMHRDLSLCYRNWTTPLSAVCLLKVFCERLVEQDSRYRLVYQLMKECQTGADRLKAPLLHTSAVIGHKTGTSDRNAEGAYIGVNDMGFVQLPDGRTYYIAVFIKDGKGTLSQLSAVIARLSKEVYESFRHGNR